MSHLRGRAEVRGDGAVHIAGLRAPLALLDDERLAVDLPGHLDERLVPPLRPRATISVASRRGFSGDRTFEKVKSAMSSFFRRGSDPNGAPLPRAPLLLLARLEAVPGVIRPSSRAGRPGVCAGERELDSSSEAGSGVWRHEQDPSAKGRGEAAPSNPSAACCDRPRIILRSNESERRASAPGSGDDDSRRS